MFQFLNPVWFFAAAALLIPVVIHLWNIRPGKVLKVGSTSLLTAASRKSSRSFKLLDVLLLLLRCLLLVLLALLLAMPVLQQRIKATRAKGWVMLPKETFSEGYRRYKKPVDSLLRLGYEFHYFNTGLPKADLARLLAEIKDPKLLDTTLKQPANYWSLLRAVDSQVPADMPVYLYTDNTINHFKGEKPGINLNLHWKIYTPADSVTTWVQKAWLTDNKTIGVVKGISGPAGTSYEYFDIQSDRGNPQFTVIVNNGQPKVSLTGSKQKPAAVDTQALNIAIYTDSYLADAGYLKAALDALGRFTQRKTTIKQYSNRALIPAGQSWVFWLSGQAVPAKLQQSKIFAYQLGKQIQVSTWINADQLNSVPSGSQQVPLFKEISAAHTGQQVIWRDGFGNPLLTFNNDHVYHFFTRFNPTWNDLVWNGNFPKMLLQLISGPTGTVEPWHDRRALTLKQILPEKNSEPHAVANKLNVEKELGKYFWLALVTVFFAERWLATRKKTGNNG